MNDLTVFSNERFGRIRTVLIDGVVWFVGKDVAAALGYSNPRKALADHVEEIDKICGVTIRDPMGREQRPTLINESGVYSLIFASKLPDAKEFKRWVTSEILPSVRTTGSYSTGVQIDTAKQQRAEAMLNNSRARVASLWLKISDMTTPEYRQVCSSYASAALCGKEVIPLPEAVAEHLYTAEEIAKELGISANKVGRLANELGLETEQYGKFFYDKAKNCNKEVQTFKYNQLAVDALRIFQVAGGDATLL